MGHEDEQPAPDRECEPRGAKDGRSTDVPEPWPHERHRRERRDREACEPGAGGSRRQAVRPDDLGEDDREQPPEGARAGIRERQRERRSADLVPGDPVRCHRSHLRDPVELHSVVQRRGSRRLPVPMGEAFGDGAVARSPLSAVDVHPPGVTSPGTVVPARHAASLPMIGVISQERAREAAPGAAPLSARSRRGERSASCSFGD